MDVFGLSKMFIYRGLLIIPTFRRCDDASAEGFEMKDAHNNYLPFQTKDVIRNPRNPVNPDSKPGESG